jgi:hypothetical protein
VTADEVPGSSNGHADTSPADRGFEVPESAPEAESTIAPGEQA